jgi:hypothetical protein
MDEQRVDREVARLLDEAQVPMSAQWQARVLESVGTKEPRPARRWRLAIGLALLAALLPLLGLGLWKLGPGRFQNPAASGDRTWEVTAITPEGRTLRSVHFLRLRRDSDRVLEAPGTGEWSDEPAEPTEHFLQYPDKMRRQPQPVPGRTPDQGTTLIRNGDRELQYLEGGWQLSSDPAIYHYLIMRPTDPLASPDVFTEASVMRVGFVSLDDARGMPYSLGDERRGEDVIATRWEANAAGERVLVAEHTKTGDPSFHGTYRTRIDPASHLVLGWHNVVEGIQPMSGRPGHDGSVVPLQEFRFEETVDQIEYNVTFAASTFDTSLPESTDPGDVFDGYTSAGLRHFYEVTLDGMARDAGKQRTPEELARSRQVWTHWFSRLDVLTPADRAAVRQKARTALGVELAEP